MKPPVEVSISMKAEQIIEESIQKAREKGVRIVRGPLFIWGHKELPEACDCSGAVLVSFGKAKRGFPDGWLKELCIDLLGRDTFWWWRFNYGFNQGCCIQLYTEKKDKSGKTKRIYFDDEVSKSGAKMAKKLGLYKK